MTETDTNSEHHVPPPTPPDLRDRGLDVWTDLNDRFEFASQELALVLQVARTVQRLDDLEAAMDNQPYVVKGSQGQPVSAPLLDTIRAYRALYVTLLRQLDLPDEDPNIVSLTANQRRAQHAAQTRWSSHVKRADQRKGA